MQSIRVQAVGKPPLAEREQSIEVVGLVADAGLPAGLADGLSPVEQHAGFAKLVNDLPGVIPFLRHGSDLFSWLSTVFDLDQLMQAGHIRLVLSPIKKECS